MVQYEEERNRQKYTTWRVFVIIMVWLVVGTFLKVGIEMFVAKHYGS